jgi:hypothetical protein
MSADPQRRPRNASTPGPKLGSHPGWGYAAEQHAAKMRAQQQDRRLAYLALEEFAPLRGRWDRPNAPRRRQRMGIVTAPADGAQGSL